MSTKHAGRGSERFWNRTPLLLVILLLAGTSLAGQGQTLYFPTIGRISHPFSAEESKRYLIARIYSSQVGIREEQVNAGPEVEKYLRYVKLPKGSPWCAAFVCWVFGEAGVQNPRTGWSPVLFPAEKVIWRNSEYRRFKAESGGRPGKSGIKPKRAAHIYPAHKLQMCLVFTFLKKDVLLMWVL